MATACIAQTTLQVHGIPKPIIARFDQPHASSDGGALLLKAVDERLGLTWRLASTIRDRRQPGKVAHPLRDLLRQRVFGLACGYADCNDAARLADDPIHKLLLDRDPLDGAALSSQPTLSRFENAVGRADLYRLGMALADSVLLFHRERLGDGARLITIDLDATDDPTHGQQELALFNGYYDTWCYLPLVATVTFNAEPMQHVVAALLRPGTGAATRGVRGLLRRLFIKLRALFPHARLRVRADAGFADAKLLAFLDAAEVEYVLGLASNRRLDKRVRRLLGRARMRARTTGETATLYGETRYAARRWDRKRRIIMKAEVLCYPGRSPKDNPRFLVTNLPHRPATVYTRLYCGRGDMENRLKELQHGVAMDRTSCSRFVANQFRLLFSVAAYALLQALQSFARTAGLGAAQVWTLRERLLKVAVWVERSVRRIVLHLPQAFPWRDTWRELAEALTAT
jgi:Transposase DDE domain group 1